MSDTTPPPPVDETACTVCGTRMRRVWSPDGSGCDWVARDGLFGGGASPVPGVDTWAGLLDRVAGRDPAAYADRLSRRLRRLTHEWMRVVADSDTAQVDAATAVARAAHPGATHLRLQPAPGGGAWVPAGILAGRAQVPTNATAVARIARYTHRQRAGPRRPDRPAGHPPRHPGAADPGHPGRAVDPGLRQRPRRAARRPGPDTVAEHLDWLTGDDWYHARPDASRVTWTPTEGAPIA